MTPSIIILIHSCPSLAGSLVHIILKPAQVWLGKLSQVLCRSNLEASGAAAAAMEIIAASG